MLVISARQEIEGIDREIMKLLAHKAELQLYVDQMDAYVGEVVKNTTKQMSDWWVNFKEKQ